MIRTVSAACYAVLLLAAAGQAYAACRDLSSAIDEAQMRLKRAAREQSLDDAQDAAKKARYALDDLASAADDCKCDDAYSEFDDAARRARRARDAGNVDEFREHLNKAIRSYNSGLTMLQSCARRR